MKVPLLYGAAALAVLLLAVLISVAVGPVLIPPQRVLRHWVSGDSSLLSPTDLTILYQLRLPRVLLASLLGAALGCAGAGYQGLFRNPLADPFVIGASSGAALGATTALAMDLQWQFWGLNALSLAALLGALAAVGTVYILSSIGQEVPTLSLLLAGVAVSTFISALVSLLMFLNDETLMTIFSWLMGSLSGRSWPVLRTAVLPVAIAILGLWALARSLDALAFGEESAASLGLQLTRLRGLVVLTATLATAAAVAAAGIIGFVGLIAPHMARLMVGPRHALLVPMSGLTGALLLLIADDLARTIAAPSEIPVGIVTALLGGPFFLYLLKTRQRELVAG